MQTILDPIEPPAGELRAVGATLPLVGAKLSVEARGGLARVVCEQRFVNHGAAALHVVYSLPLPADAAVSGFAFRIGERRVLGEIDRKTTARERFEEALAEGRTAALLDQERSSLFSQELGNIPPGAEIIAEVTLDQRLVWTDDGQWEWRFPTTVMPRYLGAQGRVADAASVCQAMAEGELPVRVELGLRVNDEANRAPSSPSHALRASALGGPYDVRFESESGERLDRDVVVRWSVAGPGVGLALDLSRSRESAHGLLTVIPPVAQSRRFARDLCVLLDTSGSMSGQPLEQARSVVLALIDTLCDEDRLELIEFSSSARRWKTQPVSATASARSDARQWLSKLRASGSTEMSHAIIEALTPLRSEAQRQVVLVTDGAIGFETEVVAAISQKLPSNARLHTVGIGSSVNRSLTAPAARAGRGAEIVIGLGEDPERAAKALLRRTSLPVLVNLELSGSALRSFAPARVPDVFAGAPVLVAVELDAAGGDLLVRGELSGGELWEQTVAVGAIDPGTGSPANAALFARERVEDLELSLAGGGSAPQIDAQIERIGLEFAISTRMTSWVAVSSEPNVDPTKPYQRVRMPHELPHGAAVEGLGLRSTDLGMLFAGIGPARGPVAVGAGAPSSTTLRRRVAPAAAAPSTSAPRAPARSGGILRKVLDYFGGPGADSERPTVTLEAKLLRAKDRSLVFTVTIPDATFAWSPGETVLLEWSDGTTFEARVDPARTTAAATVAIGQSVRIWIALDRDPPAGAPRAVHLFDEERRITLQIVR